MYGEDINDFNSCEIDVILNSPTFLGVLFGSLKMSFGAGFGVLIASAALAILGVGFAGGDADAKSSAMLLWSIPFFSILAFGIVFLVKSFKLVGWLLMKGDTRIINLGWIKSGNSYTHGEAVLKRVGKCSFKVVKNGPRWPRGNHNEQ